MQPQLSAALHVFTPTTAAGVILAQCQLVLAAYLQFHTEEPLLAYGPLGVDGGDRKSVV